MSPRTASRLPLESLRVVELASGVAGPYCGKLLADFGADVIKVEPLDGDPARREGPFPGDAPHPEKSALFLYLNTSKRGVRLDRARAEDAELFDRLIRWADVLIDDAAPARRAGEGRDAATLGAHNPDLVHVCISAYGQSGPRANVAADELTLIHAGGLANLLPARSPDVDRAPVKLGGHAVGYHGGIAAAVATLAGILARTRDGRGRLIDVSLQEVILTLVSPLVAGHRYDGTTWSRVPDRPPAMGRMQTSDGYVILGAADDHHFRALRLLMGEPEWVASEVWDDRYYRRHHLMEIAPRIDAWMREQRKDEIHHRAAELGIPIAPINTVQDVLASPQYAARGYFVEVEHAVAGRHRYPGWPYRMSVTPPRVRRPAPLLGEHDAEVRAELETPGATTPRPAGRARPPRHPIPALPLEGIRVLDLCWVWAGPYACMLLAHLGAEVIRIESHKRADLTRRGVIWPLPDPTPTRVPPNQGLGFNSLNLNKRSVTIDLSASEGVELVRRLVAISDVVVDNMRPGALAKRGLGYAELRAIRPDLIVASSSRGGQEGPESRYLGFATIHHAYGGGAYLTGYPDDHPTPGSPGDADIMNATATAYAILAALHHRHYTGEGQLIDYSQCEGVTSLIGEALLGYAMSAVIPERMGNAHPRHAPHGVYRCWGVDRWLALAVHSDAEFVTLARVIGRPELAEDARFQTAACRKANERELDRIVEGWTRERDRDWMVEELGRSGLVAAPSRDARDLYADPHLRARGAFSRVEHPELGPLDLVGLPWKMSDYTMPTRRAPLLGEHNDYVLKELLGIPDAERAELVARDVIVDGWPADRHLD